MGMTNEQSRPGIAKTLAGAFCVGGVLSVLGQLILTVLYALLGAGNQFAPLLMLVVMGVFGLLGFVFGFYTKLEAWGAFGAILPFSGFAAAVARITYDARCESGTVRAGIRAGLRISGFVVGVGFVLILAVSTASFFWPVVAPAVPSLSANLVTDCLLSFVGGGLICVICQTFMMLTRLSVPVILIIAFSLGSVLYASGLIDIVRATCLSGMYVMTFDAGANTGKALITLFSGDGIMPIVTVFVLFAIITLEGILGGLLRPVKK
jgi:hypothetical protein